MSIVASATLEKYSSYSWSNSGLCMKLRGDFSSDSKVSVHSLGTFRVEGPAVEERVMGGSSSGMCSGCWESDIL
jgi:hypothetical protein